jgi:hypothetical protein
MSYVLSLRRTISLNARRDETARLARFSDIYTAHQQTTTCFKIFVFNFFSSPTEFQIEGTGFILLL